MHYRGAACAPAPNFTIPPNASEHGHRHNNAHPLQYHAKAVHLHMTLSHLASLSMLQEITCKVWVMRGAVQKTAFDGVMTVSGSWRNLESSSK